MGNDNVGGDDGSMLLPRLDCDGGGVAYRLGAAAAGFRLLDVKLDCEDGGVGADRDEEVNPLWPNGLAPPEKG